MASLPARSLRLSASIRQGALPSFTRSFSLLSSARDASSSLKNGIGRSSSVGRGSSRVVASSAPRAYLSSSPLPAELQKFRELGYVDEDGLTVFETLHEMQVRSCEVFSDRELFGTFSEESQKFEWMTYAEYADKVDTCRAFLQSVGKFESAQVVKLVEITHTPV